MMWSTLDFGKHARYRTRKANIYVCVCVYTHIYMYIGDRMERGNWGKTEAKRNHGKWREQNRRE